MIKVGITGGNGFIGYHLYQTLRLNKTEFILINFERSFFDNNTKLDNFVKSCDVIVHLAALNRHEDSQFLYDTNIKLVQLLIASLNRTNSKPHLLISSSSQEERDNFYGKSKREGRLLLSRWANQSGGKLTGLIIPNVFGPFGRPNYNSVIATFCHQISRNQNPKIDIDGQLNLIYVGDLIEEIINLIRLKDNTHELLIPYTDNIRVSEMMELLKYFRTSYQDNMEIPILRNDFEQKLFNTYRSFIDIATYFPKKYFKHSDERGFFVEIARLGIAGQTSFSTSKPGITRGNHFHTRKIERFAVIKGKALIQLRKIGSENVHEFQLDGDHPAYVDMPIWYTHNIKNIGDDILYTIFWINEPFNPNNSDTYFELV